VEFRLTFQVEELAQKINYQQKIMLVGSCFAENMAALLAKYRFDVVQNPNGILYNPHSIAQTLQRALTGTPYTDDELFNYNGLWASWQHHSRFSAMDKQTCLAEINTAQNTAHHYLNTGNLLIVTFGSAFVYKLKNNGQLVANCHKYPNKEFDKQLLKVDEIVTQWQSFVTALQAANPAMRVILTVSPVRYVRDGVVQNNLSKAILLQAVHKLCETNNHLHYFPAYELVMDDLRDYRFFDTDLVHPNAQAIEYVWGKFAAAGFDAETQHIYPQIKQLLAAARHRPFNAAADAHQKFLATHQQKLHTLKQQYPFINLEVFDGAF
jgi:hypothetical protein